MNLTDLQSFAVKVGVFPSGNKTVLKNKIKRAFESSLAWTRKCSSDGGTNQA
jgi:hypothetical protein